MKRGVSVFIGIITISFRIVAQETLPVLAVLPFTAPPELSQQAQTIEKLVESCISQWNTVRLIDPSDRDVVLKEREFAYSSVAQVNQELGTMLHADYLVGGSLGTLGSSIVITFEIINVQTSEKRSFSTIDLSFEAIITALPNILQQSLGSYVQHETSPQKNEIPISEENIIGSWKGDKGIELVRLYRNGQGEAIFTSGARMELAYTIKEGILYVKQTSPNTERYYHPVPYLIAHQLVELAEPMEWEFNTLVGDSILRGIKRATAVRYEGDTIIEIIHKSTRDAEWTKIGR